MEGSTQYSCDSWVLCVDLCTGALAGIPGKGRGGNKRLPGLTVSARIIYNDVVTNSDNISTVQFKHCPNGLAQCLLYGING